MKVRLVGFEVEAIQRPFDVSGSVTLHQIEIETLGENSKKIATSNLVQSRKAKALIRFDFKQVQQVR
jgi:hypothetical protein